MTQSPKARLNHAAIFVSDLDRGIEFYEKAFGFELKMRWKIGERVTSGKEETMGMPGAQFWFSMRTSASPGGSHGFPRDIRAQHRAIGSCFPRWSHV